MTNISITDIIKIQKRQDLKRLCQVKRFKIAPALAGGGYFTFIVKAAKKKQGCK